MNKTGNALAARPRLALLILFSFLMVFCFVGTTFADAETVCKVEPGQVTNCILPVTVTIEGLPQDQSVNGLNLGLAYNPAVLEYQGYQKGNYLADWTWFPSFSDGSVEFAIANFTGMNPASSGQVVTITFTVVGNGPTGFSLPKLSLRDGDDVDIPLTTQISQALLKDCQIISAPAVQTIDAGGITVDSAALKGNITANGGADITEYGFYWGTTVNPTTKQSVGTDNHSGAFDFNLEGLAEDTTYYFKAYATNSVDTGAGEVKSFKTNKTQPVIDAPTVLTNDAADITVNSATLNGNITANGGADITEYGFYWGTTEEPATKQSVGTDNHSGIFDFNLQELEEDTTYYFKAYAVNSAETGYGIVKSFTTESGSMSPGLEVTVELSRVEDVNFTRPLGIEGAANESVDWEVTIKDICTGKVVANYTPAQGTSFNETYQPEATDLPVFGEYAVEVTATPEAGDPVTVTKSFGVSNYSLKLTGVSVSESGATRTVSATVANLETTSQQVQGICQVTSSRGDIFYLSIGEPVTAAVEGVNLEFTFTAPIEPGTYSVQIFTWLNTDDGWITLGSPSEILHFTI